MADYGPFTANKSDPVKRSGPLVTWGPGYFSSDGATLTGSVAEAGVPIVGAMVRLYQRSTGMLVRSTKTAADGTFVFERLISTQLNYWFIIALDPEGGTQYNALIYDRLTAV